jgi:hypothetical protein
MVGKPVAVHVLQYATTMFYYPLLKNIYRGPVDHAIDWHERENVYVDDWNQLARVSIIDKLRSPYCLGF